MHAHTNLWRRNHLQLPGDYEKRKLNGSIEVTLISSECGELSSGFWSPGTRKSTKAVLGVG